MGKHLIWGICLILVLGLFGGNAVIMAQDDDSEGVSGNLTAYVIRDGKISWLLPDEETKYMTEEEYKEKYHISAEQEAAIVHDVPPCPVIIDGVLYQPEQIHLFDGQRLGFTVDNDGKLYAFTTEEGIEKFLQEQRKALGKSALADIYSYFYVDWYYGGNFLAVPPGYPQGYIPDLGIPAIGMNNMISSFIASSSASRVSLCDLTNYGGDYFERTGGTSISVLALYGWNDKASSLIVYN